MLKPLFLALLLLSLPGRASLLSQSSVVRCDDHDDRLDCREKLLVSLVVENDRLYDTEHLEVSVGCVGNVGGEGGEGSEARCLENNMTIGVTKTPVALLYALTNPTMYALMDS